LAAAAPAARRPPSILIDVSDALFFSRKKVIFLFLNLNIVIILHGNEPLVS